MSKLVTSTRDAARLAGVGHSSIYRWIDAGRLPGRPPWTMDEVLRAAAGGSRAQRGPQEPHGTLTRYRRGCDCEACRAANAADKHPELQAVEIARLVGPLVDDLANGVGYATVLSRQKITALRRQPIIAQALDAALMAGRAPQLAHGTPGAWRAGCRCPDCRAYHNGTRT